MTFPWISVYYLCIIRQRENMLLSDFSDERFQLSVSFAYNKMCRYLTFPWISVYYL